MKSSSTSDFVWKNSDGKNWGTQFLGAGRAGPAFNGRAEEDEFGWIQRFAPTEYPGDCHFWVTCYLRISDEKTKDVEEVHQDRVCGKYGLLSFPKKR